MTKSSCTFAEHLFFWQTEPGLYLLVTFHNLSAPFTVECEGAYIEVERENNGFEARWCGNRVTQVRRLLQPRSIDRS